MSHFYRRSEATPQNFSAALKHIRGVASPADTGRSMAMGCCVGEERLHGLDRCVINTTSGDSGKAR